MPAALILSPFRTFRLNLWAQLRSLRAHHPRAYARERERLRTTAFLSYLSSLFDFDFHYSFLFSFKRPEYARAEQELQDAQRLVNEKRKQVQAQRQGAAAERSQYVAEQIEYVLSSLSGSNGGGDGDARQHKCLEMQKSKSEIYGAKR